ncbi:MAG: type II toxin-antitoxin system VapC family toxin [Proteobacteria bacterium]|nr:type II toxin-antitoxin system VapC family toxin [Pseudomonadota bacterium]
MKFWDSSAIIPLCLKEPASDTMKDILSGDEDIVVWWATRVECTSALARCRREGTLKNEDELKTKAVLTMLSKTWSEIQPGELMRQRAERLLMVHPLRAADAFQLAAALIWAQESPSGLHIICLDQNLREAAAKEGFSVLP